MAPPIATFRCTPLSLVFRRGEGERRSPTGIINKVFAGHEPIVMLSPVVWPVKTQARGITPLSPPSDARPYASRDKPSALPVFLQTRPPHPYALLRVPYR